MGEADETIKIRLDGLGTEAIGLLKGISAHPDRAERFKTIMEALRLAQKNNGYAAQVVRRVEAAARTPGDAKELTRLAVGMREQVADAQTKLRKLLAVAHRLNNPYLVTELNQANALLKKTLTAIENVRNYLARL